MEMDIYQALRETISPKKRQYFVNKHGLYYQIGTPIKTDEEMCKLLGVKSLSEYKRWEGTQEYNRLLQLYLQTKFSDDLEKIYIATQKKATEENDEKAIKLLLEIQKQIRLFNKENNKKTDNVDIYDGLEL